MWLEIRVASRLQSQCQEYILDIVVVRQYEVSQIFLAHLSFEDYAQFIVLEVQIINLFNQFRCVFHPEFKDVSVSFFYIRVLNLFCEVWNRLSSETYACFVEKCLTSFRYDVVVLAHVHVADCGPNIRR